jgi:ketosteroid isomerase-like protein
MARHDAHIAEGVRTALTATASSRNRRKIDEAIFVRFPGLARAIGAAWSRLPPSSRLRRALIKRVVTQGCDAANRRDLEAMLILFDPEVELHVGDTPAAAMVPPDLVGIHRGRQGYVRVIKAVTETIEDFRLNYEEVIDYGDQLLIVCRQTGRGRLSGVPYDQPFFQVLSIGKGRVFRQENFTDRAQASAAIGPPKEAVRNARSGPPD